MRKIFLTALAGLTAAAALGGQVYYSCDFEEGYTEGDLQGQHNWTVRSTDGYSNAENAATVGSYNGRRCVKIERGNGYDGVIVKEIPETPKGSFVKVSFKFFWPAGSGVSSVLFTSHWWNRPMLLRFSLNDKGKIQVYALQDDINCVPQVFRTKSFNQGEWIEVSYTVDFNYQMFDTLTVNDTVGDISTVALHDDSKNLKSFAVNVDAGADICVDDIKVETVEHSGNPRLVLKTDRFVIASKNASAKMPMYNFGEGEITYRASVDDQPEWLTVKNPEGTFTANTTLDFNLDRSLMATNVYYRVLHLEAGAAGSKEVMLKIHSKGAIAAYSFDPPALYPGEITGQDGWKGRSGDGYGPNDMSMDVTNVSFGVDGPCGYIHNSYGWDGYDCPVKSDGENPLIRVSMKIRKGSESTQDSFYLRNSWWNFLYEFWFWVYEGNFYLYKFNLGDSYAVTGFHPFPLDTWLDLSFTIDMRLYRLTEFSLGDFSTNFVKGFELYTKHDSDERYTVFNTLAFICGNTDVTDAELLVDDILVTELEREKKPVPVMERIVPVDPKASSMTVPLLNAGGRGFNYTLSVLDLPNNIVPNPNRGRVGEAAELKFDLKTSKLEDAFYRSRVVLDYKGVSSSGDGSLTSLFTLAKGGWYYTTDFETGGYEPGNLRGQDTWTAGGVSSETNPQVAEKEGEQCACLPGEGYMKSACFIPAESDFTFKCRFFVEEGDDEGYAKLTFIDDTGFLPFYICRDNEIGRAVLGYIPAGGDTFEPLFTAPLDSWQNFSVSMNTNLEFDEVTAITFGDYETNFPPGSIFLKTEYDACAVSNLTIRVERNTEEEVDVAPFWFDNIVVRDSSVPEPAALCLLVLAFACARVCLTRRA